MACDSLSISSLDTQRKQSFTLSDWPRSKDGTLKCGEIECNIRLERCTYTFKINCRAKYESSNWAWVDASVDETAHK